MKSAVVLGGKTGLLGQALCLALSRQGWTVNAPGRDELNLFERPAVEEYLARTGATVLFNTVAYTKVDQAEDEPAEASRLNRQLPLVLGKAVQNAGVFLVHYSTDFVFNGRKTSPYAPGDQPAPGSVYGQTKLLGERELLALDLPNLLIIRTSWLFGPCKTNFVTRILELAATRPELSVVHDQIGSPSYTPDLAAGSLALLDKGATGIFHLANAGQASWCELATEAVRGADLACRIKPIPSSEYPQKACRPAYSVLDLSAFTAVTGIAPRPWVQALREFLFSREDCLS
ncbi:dTDP-4-dehydrorhamnose reductase [Desulfomicrobium norvegicum]|uniref:dTDP-4-dehydrorhamnose reductase n=1 Tax=Desulfomicrobium norvegicum (strain DSM 1741 / NCIMB 8310) TaxID=52561 RepID=A0A8G2F6V0_DESNO|nr:dTDP-4-dehydrorhamnose reductase [Desulfomicrobium norvegicum]SFL52353.1 dTDP-4-dehydrorhamnose reductase [Desulfomicrobium norvegicum]